MVLALSQPEDGGPGLSMDINTWDMNTCLCCNSKRRTSMVLCCYHTIPQLCVNYMQWQTIPDYRIHSLIQPKRF